MGVPVSPLVLDRGDYERLLAQPSAKRFEVYDYVHSKTLEYLTSLTLGALEPGEVLLDAAGGGDAEFIRVAREQLDFAFVGYSQDAQLSGTERDGIHFVGGSVDSIPLPDESVDVITCHHSIEHFRESSDSGFIREACRLMKPGGRTIVVPIFLTNCFAEIWNRRPEARFDPTATQIVDRTAAFAGWGPYEGFARTYDVTAFRRRVLDELSSDVTASIHPIVFDDAPTPDPTTNRHIPVLNREMKVLLLERS
jgi:SAM-dependent methyltransferase